MSADDLSLLRTYTALCRLPEGSADTTSLHEELYATLLRHSPRMYRLCLRWTGDPQMASALTGEALTLAIRKLPERAREPERASAREPERASARVHPSGLEREKASTSGLGRESSEHERASARVHPSGLGRESSEHGEHQRTWIWLFRLTYTLAMDAMRIRIDPLLQDGVLPPGDPILRAVSGLSQRERASVIQSAARSLGAAEQEIVYLRYAERLPTNVIARLLRAVGVLPTLESIRRLVREGLAEALIG